MTKLTTLLSAAVVTLGVSMSTPAAAAPWTVTTTGTISSGYDTSGVFGAANTSLYGMSFSNSITLDPTAYTGGYSYSDANQNYNYGTLSGTATNTVTVGNVTKTFTWDLSQYNWGESYLGAYSSNYGAGYSYDQAYQTQSGYTADGSWLESYGYLYSYANAFGLSTSFNQNWSRTAQAGDYGSSYFGLSGNSGSAYFWGDASAISINAAVPEPETYAMLLAGLGLMGFIARRRKNSAV